MASLRSTKAEPDFMTQSLIALGSNLGERSAHMRHALVRLGNLPSTKMEDVSALYETAPVGGPDNQGPYLNAAALIRTALSPAQLLEAVQGVEAERQRERIIRWGPRTLDLDILTYGEFVSDDPDLTLPHPRMHERRFVMMPVCDIAPDLPHPRLGRSMLALLRELPAEPDDLTVVSRMWGDEILGKTEKTP